MENKDKIILDLCGGTGAWSKPYKDAGYNVKVITLPEYDIRGYRPLENIYGILSAPPCTEFSIAKGSKPRNFTLGMETVKACLNIVWECRYAYKLKFWVLENPRGFLRQFLGKPTYTFEQWEFGDLGIKPTDLWGYFNYPKKPVKNRPLLTKRFPSKRTSALKWARSPEKRAITPEGFAKAFFEANR